jgi:esterase/lipase superfamily enzyme
MAGLGPQHTEPSVNRWRSTLSLGAGASLLAAALLVLDHHTHQPAQEPTHQHAHEYTHQPAQEPTHQHAQQPPAADESWSAVSSPPPRGVANRSGLAQFDSSFPPEPPTESAAEGDLPLGLGTTKSWADYEADSQLASPPSEPAPPSEPTLSRTPAPQLASGPRSVEVFYATDRLPLAQLLPRLHTIFLPVAAALLVTLALLIGTLLAKRLMVAWLAAACLACVLSVVVTHSAAIRWQRVERLVANSEWQYTGRRDESRSGQYPLHLGTAEVSLPPLHRVGRLEQPSLLRLEFVETPEKHVVLHRVTPMPDDGDWFHRLRQQMQTPHAAEAFVFIHGYNVRFDDALKRTAQLAVDLQLPGPAICYSWPSRGVVAGYAADEATVSWTAPHLERLFLDIRQRTGCRSLNVLAHSMGNRALLEAAERVALRSPEPPKLLDQVVLAAPDVDAPTFIARYSPAVRSVARQVTLYTSSTDRALDLSNRLHGGDRLGLSIASIARVGGVDTIDVSGSSPWSFGHGYYGDSPEVIADLRAVLLHSRTANTRPWLQPQQTPDGGYYWRLDADRQAILNPASSIR